ncbi:MAG: hypothetical protein ACYCTW_09525, partial [Sulfuricella sp.]
DWVIQAPLYVLLDRPGETNDLWQGWPVSADTDYASSWDFVLQEQDAPFDPEAGMVQVWNPVRLYLPMAGRVVAELRSERLYAVRAMAADFLLSNDPIDNSWPGRISVRETSTGIKVATGSPIGGQNDPRWRYQNMYHYAAEAIRAPANIVLVKAGVFEQDRAQEVNRRIEPTRKQQLFRGLEQIVQATNVAIMTLKPFIAGYHKQTAAMAGTEHYNLDHQVFKFDQQLRSTDKDAASVKLSLTQKVKERIIPHEQPFILTTSVYLVSDDPIAYDIGIQVNGQAPSEWKPAVNKKEVVIRVQIRASDNIEYVLRRGT